MLTRLSHCLSLAPQGREWCFQAGLLEGALAHTTLAQAGGLTPSLPHPTWAGPGRGINRSDRWAFPTLPVSPNFSLQCLPSLQLVSCGYLTGMQGMSG